jgi:hypothetical protein
MLKSQMKKVLITFFDIKNIVHFQFIPQGQRFDQAYYVERILSLLHEVVLIKGPELRTNDWIFRHSSSPAHKALCQAVSGPKIDN